MSTAEVTADGLRRIVVLGGGFGGIYAVRELERLIGDDPTVEITLVNSENFFLFTPMLHEVAASDLDLTHIVNPIRKLLERARFFNGNVQSIDCEKREVVVTHGVEIDHPHRLPYDHLVLAMGSVTNFWGLPGLDQRAFTLKSLGDAIALRNRLIDALEEADFECCLLTRRRMLTFVVAGGGFAGVEAIAGINDFLREAVRHYPHLTAANVRTVLIHSGDHILPELGADLGKFAAESLSKRGVDIRLGVKVRGMNAEGVELSDGTSIETANLIWTAGTSPNPLLATLPLPRERGRVVVEQTLQVTGWPGIWSLGDCAQIPDGAGGFYPPTAQHATRQGKVLARNIVAALHGKPAQPFRFKTLGQLAAIGRRTGVAKVFGFKFSGFVAWWMWRTIYLSKLPRFERKVRVALDWSLDLFFTKDLVKCPTALGPDAAEMGFEPRPRPITHDQATPGIAARAS
ncbi:MAG: NAD(P)/FAD-dependent oxidoreductase [Acidobacteriota bacterium]